MAEAVNNPTPVEGDEDLQDETLSERFMNWVRTELVWYAGSFSFHLLLLSILLLLPNFSTNNDTGDAPVFETKVEPEKKIPDVYDIGKTQPQEQPPMLNVDPTTKPSQQAQAAEYNDASNVFEHKGGGTQTGMKDMMSAGGATAFGSGPKMMGSAGVGGGLGTSKTFGNGGAGSGFGTRGSGSRKAMLAINGGNPASERAVTAALIWLAHHQSPDGHWGLKDYDKQCKDKTCTGLGDGDHDTGATAMGLLPFLAAGQTHLSKGPYRETINRGLNWLMAHQHPDGALAKEDGQEMYAHGLATIALSEAFGLSGDPKVKQAADQAIYYIVNAQNTETGGWRYRPKADGDTSVVGWQLMALKSARMAGLLGGSEGENNFTGTSKWLDSVQQNNGTEYAYRPGQGPVNTMTSVGLLCRQYLGAKRDNPMLTGGMAYLLNNLPNEGDSNIYYWYYATQVMHNMGGDEWKTWNHTMRDLLVNSQVNNSSECANGSWNPANDHWGKRGGRVMQTSLSCLTLEIYYRYLPLFKTDDAAVAAANDNAPKLEIGGAANGKAAPNANDAAGGGKADAAGGKAAGGKAAGDKAADAGGKVDLTTGADTGGK